MITLHRLLFSLIYVSLGLLVRRSGANHICGGIGTHNYTGTTFYMGNFFFKAPSTFALCADFCKNDSPRCKSFRYSYDSAASAQYCEFFPEFLETFFINDNSQPYFYYDIDCAFPTYAVTETAVQLSITTAISLIATTTTSASTVTNMTKTTETFVVTTTTVSRTTITTTTTKMNTALATRTWKQLVTSISTVLVPTTQRFTAISTLLVPTTSRITTTATILRSATQTILQTLRSTVTAVPTLQKVAASTVYVTISKTSPVSMRATSISIRAATFTSRLTTTLLRPTYFTQTRTILRPTY
ncbi:hypothetical protein PSPO01_16120 [Paraphaeosphaeria sporulosa]